jgi:hypothetical protein
MGKHGSVITNPSKAEAQLRDALETPRAGRPSAAFIRAQEARAAADEHFSTVDLLWRRTFKIAALEDSSRALCDDSRLDAFWQGMTKLPDEIMQCVRLKMSAVELRERIDRLLAVAAKPIVDVYAEAGARMKDWEVIQLTMFPEPYTGPDPAGDCVRKHIKVEPRATAGDGA